MTVRRQVIAVVGSVNLDLVVRTTRLPRLGETVLGQSLAEVPGGKGANQAVAAARLDADVRFLARVGDDAFGSRLRQSLQAAGVGVEHVLITPNTTSGVALIEVDAAGQNSIVVISGANAALSPADIDAQSALITTAEVLLMQLETPPPTLVRAVKLARDAGVLTVLDPAPAPSCDLPDELYEVDCLSPNQSEAEALTGTSVQTVDDARRAAEALSQRGAQTVVIKLGEYGAVWRDAAGQTGHVPAPRVKVVDTTAAGDAFTAALTWGLAQRWPLPEAVEWGCAAGALAVTKAGAQSAMPTLAEVQSLRQQRAV